MGFQLSLLYRTNHARKNILVAFTSSFCCRQQAWKPPSHSQGLWPSSTSSWDWSFCLSPHCCRLQKQSPQKHRACTRRKRRIKEPHNWTCSFLCWVIPSSWPKASLSQRKLMLFFFLNSSSYTTERNFLKQRPRMHTWTSPDLFRVYFMDHLCLDRHFTGTLQSQEWQQKQGQNLVLLQCTINSFSFSKQLSWCQQDREWEHG